VSECWRTLYSFKHASRLHTEHLLYHIERETLTDNQGWLVVHQANMESWREWEHSWIWPCGVLVHCFAKFYLTNGPCHCARHTGQCMYMLHIIIKPLQPTPTPDAPLATLFPTPHALTHPHEQRSNSELMPHTLSSPNKSCPIELYPWSPHWITPAFSPSSWVFEFKQSKWVSKSLQAPW
jgi:hypothetical protein